MPSVAAAQVSGGGLLCSPDDPVYKASLASFRLLRCRNSAAVVRAAASLDLLLAGDDATRMLLIDNLVRARLRSAALTSPCFVTGQGFSLASTIH